MTKTSSLVKTSTDTAKGESEADMWIVFTTHYVCTRKNLRSCNWAGTMLTKMLTATQKYNQGHNYSIVDNKDLKAPYK